MRSAICDSEVRPVVIVLREIPADVFSRLTETAIFRSPDFLFLQATMEPFDVAVAFRMVISRAAMCTVSVFSIHEGDQLTMTDPQITPEAVIWVAVDVAKDAAERRALADFLIDQPVCFLAVAPGKDARFHGFVDNYCALDGVDADIIHGPVAFGDIVEALDQAGLVVVVEHRLQAEDREQVDTVDVQRLVGVPLL